MEAAFETLKQRFKDSIISYIWMEEKDTSHSFGFKDPRYSDEFRHIHYEKALIERFQTKSQHSGMICRSRYQKGGVIMNEQFFLYLSDEKGWSKITLSSRNQDQIILQVIKRHFLTKQFVFQENISALPEMEDVFLDIISELPEFRLHVVTGNIQQKG